MSKELSSLENEMEEVRERLAATIDQLVYRASPKTIARREYAQLKAHFVDAETGAARTDNIVKVAGGVVGFVVLLVAIRRIVN